MTFQEPPSLSLVCVFNDLAVREHCLDRSIEAYDGPVEFELVAMDNRHHTYATAGAALNQGVELSRHDIVVFVHQDVYLHSIDRLAEAALAFREGSWGLLGASGVTHDDQYVGRMRDRLRLNGDRARSPVEVDSVDEVLFMAPRELLIRSPLTEDPALNWHAYAVELGLRLRTGGMRVGAVDMAITHNSMSVNMVGLEEAHHHVGSLYPQFPAVRTTCGVIGSTRRRWRHLPVVRDHGWRLRWMRESALAARVRRVVDAPVVLGELFEEVDHIGFDAAAPLYLFNLDRSGGFGDHARGSLVLNRRDRPIVMTSCRDPGELPERLAALPADAHVVIEDLSIDDLELVGTSVLRGRDWVVGIQPMGLWLLAGPAARELPEHWRRRQAVPLGARSLTRRGLTGSHRAT